MSPAPPFAFRDVSQGRVLQRRLEETVARAGREITVMHVCGSQEQAMARFGLRARLPAGLHVQMGPGCPVCVTDAPEIDAAVTLAEAGLHVVTYGDMLRVPGSEGSLDDARARGARVSVVYSALQTLEIAAASREPVVFFASGFETTAVATAALLLRDPPDHLFVYSAHKWVPAAMEAVAASPDSRVEGFLAAGHAASITGWGIFEPFAARHECPVVVAGFEPLDLLAGLLLLVQRVVHREPGVFNAFPRCVSRDGNRTALAALDQVFEAADGTWRGIARIAGGDLRLKDAFARWDATRRFEDVLTSAPTRAQRPLAASCRCGDVLTGAAVPTDCAHFGSACTPERPVGACMVSTEGPCRIWLENGVQAPGARPEEVR